MSIAYPERPDIDLFKLFNFRLWRLASATSAPVIRLCEGVYGLSRQEWSLLSVVVREGRISPSELAQQVSLDRPRASKCIRVLIDKGFLMRQQAPGEKRRYLLVATPHGYDLASKIFPDVLAINERVIGSLNPQARAFFEDTLAELTDHALRLNEAAPSPIKANRRRSSQHGSK